VYFNIAEVFVKQFLKDCFTVAGFKLCTLVQWDTQTSI